MPPICNNIQTADWKAEKHVPAIDAPDAVEAGEMFEVKVSLGKEIAHPNSTEHHIRWIRVFFHPEGDKFTYDVGNFEFAAHGESAAGANEGPVYTDHSAAFKMRTSKPGTLHAMALCNIHGLWESEKPIRVE
jgi:superoxide reductase